MLWAQLTFICAYPQFFDVFRRLLWGQKKSPLEYFFIDRDQDLRPGSDGTLNKPSQIRAVRVMCLGFQ